jgi:transcription factor MYB, plant
VKNFWNSYVKKKLRQRGIDPATHKPLPLAAEGISSRTAVFSDAELILSSPAAAAGRHMPPPPVTASAAESYVYSYSHSSGGASDGSLQSLSGYNSNSKQTAADHLGAAAAAGYLQQEQDPAAAAAAADALHCGPSGAPAVVLPSVSSSSTLNSMAGLSPAATTTDEQCTNNCSSCSFHSGLEPWLELGSTSGYYGAALDELKWSDYVFDGGYGGQPGQGIYGDSKDAVQFVDANALSSSSWCLN